MYNNCELVNLVTFYSFIPKSEPEHLTFYPLLKSRKYQEVQLGHILLFGNAKPPTAFE